MGIISNGSFWIYDVEELRSQDLNWPTHEGWGELIVEGNTTWQVPDGVYSISVVMIGGGGQGTLNPAITSSNTGGGGGQLVYLNDIPVTPRSNVYFGQMQYPQGGQYDGGTGGFSPVMIDPSSPDFNVANTMLIALGGGPGRFYGATNTRLDSHGARANIGGGSPESISTVGSYFTTNNLVPGSAFTNADGGGAGGYGSTFGSGGAGGYAGKGGNAATTVNVAAESIFGGAGTQRYDSTREQHIGGGTFPFGTGLGNYGIAPYVPGGSPSSRTNAPSKHKIYGSNTFISSSTFRNISYNNGFVHNLACHAFPSDPWPQYRPALSKIWNTRFEYGWGGGECHNTLHTIVDIPGSSTPDSTPIAWFSGIIRIVWPGNVRKFPSTHVQYIPNPGSTFQLRESNTTSVREDFIFTGYSLNNGYTAP